MVHLTTSETASLALGCACGIVTHLLAKEPLVVGSVAIAGCVTVMTYQLWQKVGKDYLASYIAKTVDAAFKSQAEAAENVVISAIQKKFPVVNDGALIIKKCLEGVVNEHLEAYSTNPQIVRQVIDDLDQGVPYAHNASLEKFASQVTAHVLAKKGLTRCTFLRRPLNRIVSALASRLLKTATDAASAKIEAKLKEYEASAIAGTIEKQCGVNISKPLTQETALEIDAALKGTVVGEAVAGVVKNQFGVDLSKVVEAHVGKSAADVAAEVIQEKLKDSEAGAAVVGAVQERFGVDLGWIAQGVGAMR